MFRPENFIYFLTVSGFFIGLMFAIMNGFDVMDFLLAIFFVTSGFYILGLVSSSLFIKSLSVKQLFYLQKDELENVIDYQIDEIEKREAQILEAHYFIEDIERQEAQFYNSKDKK